MRNITMTIHTKPLVYRSQTNSIGLSGMAATTSRENTKVSYNLNENMFLTKIQNQTSEEVSLSWKKQLVLLNRLQMH